MELYTPPRLSPSWASELCEQYLDRLPITTELRRQLLRLVAERQPQTTAEAMAALHAVMADMPQDPDHPACASINRRLELAHGLRLAGTGTGLTPAAKPVLVTSLPIRRTPIAPRLWPPFPLHLALEKLKQKFNLNGNQRKRRRRSPEAESPDPKGKWHRIGGLRRIVLLLLVIAQTVVATHFMQAVLPYHGGQPAEVALLALFAILCAWVSAGFWTAMMGYYILRFGADRYSINGKNAGNKPIPETARTAIVMPICNENVPRVFAGLQATYESLQKTGELSRFDFFVLSDSSSAETRIAENEAWLNLCRDVAGFGRIFYRWRLHRIKRKSGNITDFCRRWGRNYRYMVIMDADSIMSGDCLTKLVRLMEANPNAGLIQTAPRAIGRDTLYARLQQFATRVYGPLFVAGLHFWQLGESHYWGHNAIIRVAPFMQHCALGRLPGRGPLSGEILSHDFVEAALMRRAGWAVWIAYDLEGSYEELPPNLIDELKRDRRWCLGNLINFRLFMAPGLNPVHRAVFVTGAVAYISAPLWFAFLLLSTWLLGQHVLVVPEYFVEPKQLFPVWPEWHPERALALFTATATWLFLPKLLGVMRIGPREVKGYGGYIRLTISMLWEWLFSMLLAPIRMLFHTQFVAGALTGLRVQWQSPPREDTATTWNEALHRHGWHTLLGLIWIGVVYWLKPSFLWWLIPVVGALLLAIPISVFSSQAGLGRLVRKGGFFLIPEESHPPIELQRMLEVLNRKFVPHNFIDAVVDPGLNALICTFNAERIRHPRRITASRLHLIEFALRNGPFTLTREQKMLLLSDASILSRLHFLVWVSAATHPNWLRRKHLRPQFIKPGTERQEEMVEG